VNQQPHVAGHQFVALRVAVVAHVDGRGDGLIAQQHARARRRLEADARPLQDEAAERRW
jgi:hypothetical protein